jgi:hypothetical protein
LTVLAVALSACSGNGAEPLALTEIEPGVLELTTTCADALSADVEETVEEVRISDVRGEFIDGDCVGVLKIRLDAPLNGRAVIVDGDRWVDLPSTCGWGAIGPADLGDRSRFCSSD